MKKKLLLCALLPVVQQSCAMQGWGERIGNAWQNRPSLSSLASRLSLPAASNVATYGSAALAPFAMQRYMPQWTQKYSPYSYLAPGALVLALGAYLNRQEGASGALRSAAWSLPALLAGLGSYYYSQPQEQNVGGEGLGEGFVDLGESQDLRHKVNVSEVNKI